jgi:hypothetical protein
MEKYLINGYEVQFEVFVLSLMACKKAKDRHEVDYMLDILRTGNTYKYVFKTGKILLFTIKGSW